jgi:hypothetical protein
MSKESTSTNPTKTKPATTLILTAGGRGGSGKTTTLALIADHLEAQGRGCGIIDCDLENAGTPSAFGNWFGGKASQLDLRDVEACDTLLRQASQSGAEFCLADLPANSSGDLADWLENVATPDLIRSLGLRIVTVCAVNPTAGAAESASHWMSTLGERSRYLVALNRTQFERRPKPQESTFDAWFQWVVDNPPETAFETIDIPHLHAQTMTALISLQKLPGKAIKDPHLDIILRSRIEAWVKKVRAQLDSSGLFSVGNPVVAEATA